MTKTDPIRATLEDSTVPMALRILSEKLRLLEEVVRHCAIPTGNAIQDLVNQCMLDVIASPNGSDVQERLVAEACGATHKGLVKLGADATLAGDDLEIKPCKSTKTVSAVNITDDTPTRLAKDLKTPGKIVVIARCPGGMKFRWVVACLMSDFAESRYKAMCKKWKQPVQPWPAAHEEQIQLVEALEPFRREGDYLRSSTLKFADVKVVLGSWVHPDEVIADLKSKSSEVNLMRKIGGM
jgi:hypothetical protein